VKKKYIYCVRIAGTPRHRRYVVQRSDGLFLGAASRWVDEQPLALVYRTAGEAQVACQPFLMRQCRGQPRRQFTCTLAVTVVGDAGTVTAADVADYLREVLHIGIDYEVPHDGPLADHHVEVRALVGGMTEEADDKIGE
jgi:hypothetical protein